ncbi:MAG: cytidyltransferase, partial [Anaerovoracaceae bacterium]
LDGICREPEEGWLVYAKNETIDKLFPVSCGSTAASAAEADEETAAENYEKGTAVLYAVLRVLLSWQNEKSAGPAAEREIIRLLDREEAEESVIKEEYEKFRSFWEENYIYEFMILFRDVTGFNTWGHISGVHFVAMHMAKQLKKAGLPVDLALVSASSAAHDLGKFGCRGKETAKIPYLHYYYTDRLMKSNGMPVIAHIASNHSTWDLELENLSVESLLLIYADFRVKSTRDEENREIVNFYNLKESFDVILNKLDNVDDKKRRRYERVYAKLHDFEAYMHAMNISSELDSEGSCEKENHPAALMNAGQVIESFKFAAIEHNIVLMSKFNDEKAFTNLMETARSEKQWKNIRAYLNIFEEYFTYMTQKQKLITLNFLYEMLTHREGDIRRQAASIMAEIIVEFDEEFRKELPENAFPEKNETDSFDLWAYYLENIVFPDYKLTEQLRRWMGYSLRTVIFVLLEKAKNDVDRAFYVSKFCEYFNNRDVDDMTAFTISEAAQVIHVEYYNEQQIKLLLGFAGNMVKREVLEIKISAMKLVKYFMTQINTECMDESLKNFVSELLENAPEETLAADYLAYKILEAVEPESEKTGHYREKLYSDRATVSDIYLDNLKLGTPWVLKSVNIEFLLGYVKKTWKEESFHAAAHFSNLVKVSERITVRHSAGRGLLSIMKYLSLSQRNEIVIELTKGLEMGEYQYSKYVPQYLGAAAMYLHPRELNEFIQDLTELTKSTNSKVVSVALDTVGVMIIKYSGYRERFAEPEEVFQNRRNTLLGVLLRGLANYDDIACQEAFLVLGHNIFESRELSLCEKRDIFRVVYKKMMTLISDKNESELEFYNNAAALNHIYRFISDFMMEYGDFDFEDNRKIAFFPGTFDPFTLGHKGIVKEIKKLGFDVYLALDEFSWSKKSQPQLIRQKIASMSVASESNVFIFPNNISINIANPKDLKKLREIFSGRELYVVVGSDVIENASSYKKAPEEYSIHSMNHIVFKREGTVADKEDDRTSGSEYGKITGKIIELTLPTHLEDISSTRIRENIDNDRDISNLMDTLAQNYIYKNSLYLREPQYKSVFETRDINFAVFSRVKHDVLREIRKTFKGRISDEAAVREYPAMRKSAGAVVVRDGSDDNRILAASLYHELDLMHLYEEFGNFEEADEIRNKVSGKVLVLAGMFIDIEKSKDEMYQILLTETLAEALNKGYTFAVYNPMFSMKDKKCALTAVEVLKRQGFMQSSSGRTYYVDMNSPVIIFENVVAQLKNPFNKNERVLEVISRTYQRMQTALTKIYKGSLVLSFNSDIIHRKLIDKITAENGVPNVETKVRKLGPYMCVPFAGVLEGKAVPNTVTKKIHTEKVYDRSLESFIIREYPNYPDLETQLKMIESFNRKVILVDDLIHIGDRIGKLDTLFKKSDIEIQKTIVGVLSGRGQDLMSLQNRAVDSAYFIPNLKTWFEDDALYPFIGGDSVDRENNMNSPLIPSINMILPYAASECMAGEDRESVFEFSLVCLENARDILEVIQEEFQKYFERKLTLGKLGEAILSPRCPDRGNTVLYDENAAPSVYVEEDIEKLLRLKNII